MFFQTSSAVDITSPRALQRPILDVELNSFINNLYREVKKSEEERLIRQRVSFVAWLKSNYTFYSKYASTNKTSIFHVLKTQHSAVLEKQVVDESEWHAFITYFNSIKDNDFQKNTAEFNFYLFVRNELELVFFQTPQFINSNSLDDLINSINQKQNIAEKDYQSLLLSLNKLHYSNNDPSLRITAIKDLTPAIEALVNVDLFNKINFIRLLLQVNTKNKKGQYYRRSKVDCATTSEFITTLKQSRLLNQYNLELVFKLFNTFTNDNVKTDAISVLASLRKQLGEDEEIEMTRLQEILLSIIPGFKIELTENELSRLGLSEDEIDEQVIEPIASEYQRMLTQIALTEDAETEEKAPESWLTRFAKTTHLRKEEIRKLARKAKDNTTDLASMMLTLHKKNMVTAENFMMVQYVIDNLQIINASFTLLTHYEVYPSPQETLINITTIPAIFLEAIYELIFWLPYHYRDQVTCLGIIEHASYAKDLLIACKYEAQIFPDRDVLEIVNSNLQFKESLASLIRIYKSIGIENFPRYQHQLEALTANKLYATPSFAQNFTQALPIVPPDVTLDIIQALNTCVEKHNQWIEYLNQLNSCELIFVNSKTGYTTSANVAYFLRWDEDDNTNLISVAYANKISKAFVEFELNEDNIVALAQEFTQPVKSLSVQQLNLINQHTRAHPHTQVPEAIIKELAGFPEPINFKYMSALIASLQIIHEHEAYNELTPIIKSYFENNLELTQGLIKLIDNNLYEIKYVSLLELRPDAAIQVADILVKLKNMKQLNDLNFLRFTVQLYNYPDYLSHYSPVMTDQVLIDFLYCETDEMRPLLLDADNDDVAWTDTSVSTITGQRPDSSITGRLKEMLGDPDFLDLAASLEEASDTADSQIPPAYQLSQQTTHTSPGNETDIEELDGEDEEESVQQTSPSRITASTAEDIKIDFATLVDRCREDKNSGCCPWLFTRSPFLEKVDKKEITTIEQVEAYTRLNPTSRTSRIYLNMKVEKMNVSPAKDFLTTYFREYTFSLFQRSKLVPKLLVDCSLQTIKDHAELEPDGRTHEILSRNLRL